MTALAILVVAGPLAGLAAALTGARARRAGWSARPGRPSH